MADIVNLRQVRKAKARAEKDAKASANRVLFGRTKAERERAAQDAERAASRLEGHRLDEPEDATKP